ncbi:hypothetical protein Tsubulata_046368, partial [Turnera subulata]
SAAAAAASSTTTSATGVVKALSRALYRERNLKSLVKSFKKASENDRFRTRAGVYKDTIRRLTDARRFSDIEEILEEQKKYSDISKEGFNVRLISLYGQSGMFHNALKVFEEMPQRNCKRTALSFNALLGAGVNSGKFEKVVALFRELPEKLEIEPDLFSYNTVIKAFREMGSLDLAVSCLDEMEKKGIEPDLITFNTLLNGFYGNGRFVDGERIWGRMLEKEVVPDIKTYNARLVGLAKANRAKDALELVEEMKKKGHKLDVFSFNALIEGFVNEKNLEEVKLWYGRMQNPSGAKPNKSTFGTLIPFVCEKGDFAFAFRIVNDLFKGKEVIVDQPLLQRVVDGLVVTKKIEAAKELVELGSKYPSFQYSLKLPLKNKLPNADTAAKIISSSCGDSLNLQNGDATTTTTNAASHAPTKKRGHFEKMVERFKKSSESSKFRSRIDIYASTVRRLARYKRFSMIQEILDHQRNFLDITSEPFAAYLISLYGRVGMYDNARRLFDEMPAFNCPRTVHSFNALLSACIDSGRFEETEGIVKGLREELGITLDLVSYNIAMKGFCKMGDFANAELVVDEIARAGLEPNVITFNTLLNGFYQNQRFADGERIWRQMVEMNISPNKRSYSAKLVGLALERRVEEAVELVEEMKSVWIEPDVFCFNALIRGFVICENMEEAKRWYGEMRKRDCAPDKTTFEILVPFLCNMGDLDSAVDICLEILEHKCFVETELLQLVVDGLVKESRIQDAEKLVKLGKKNNADKSTARSAITVVTAKGATRTANTGGDATKTVTTMTIESTAVNGRRAKTQSKFEKMVEHFKKSTEDPKFRNNRGNFYGIISRLVASKRPAMIVDVLEHLKQLEDVTSESYAVRMMNFYAMAGMFERARQVFDEMPESNCTRTLSSFNALLSACITAGKFDEVEGLFRELPDRLGLTPDAVSYNIVIHAFFEMGNEDSGVSMLQEMEEKGVEPNLVTFNTVLEGFYRKGRFVDGEKMWALMESKNVVPGVRSYNARLQGLLSENRVEEAIELLHEMESKGIKPNAVSYDQLIGWFCKDGNLEGAKEWYTKLSESCKPRQVTYVTLIPFLSSKGDLDLALQLCKEAISRRVNLWPLVVRPLVDGLVDEGRIEEANDLLQLGKSRGYFWQKLNIRSV